MTSLRDPAIVLTLLVIAGYLAVARVVGNLYPFSTFSMYAGERLDSASRILAREADGSVHEIAEYRAWRCEEPFGLEREAELCGHLPHYYTIPYVDREIADRIHEASAAVADAKPLTIVRRVFRFPNDAGGIRVQDCELARCRAGRR